MQVKFSNNIKQYSYIKNNQPHLTKRTAWMGYIEQQEGGNAQWPAMWSLPDTTDSVTKCQNNDKNWWPLWSNFSTLQFTNFVTFMYSIGLLMVCSAVTMSTQNPQPHSQPQIHSPHAFDPLIFLLWCRSRHSINRVFACNSETHGNKCLLGHEAVTLGKMFHKGP